MLLPAIGIIIETVLISFGINSLIGDKNPEKVEPEKVEPDKSEIEEVEKDKVEPEKNGEEEVCLEPTKVETKNEGQEDVETGSSNKKHNWWRNNILAIAGLIVAIATLIVTIIFGLIDLYFKIKGHENENKNEVEIIKNEIKNNKGKIEALFYNKGQLHEYMGKKLLCAKKIVSLMQEVDDVYNNVDLLLNNDPLKAKDMMVRYDVDFVIAVDSLRKYYKANRNVIFDNTDEDYNDKYGKTWIINRSSASTSNNTKLSECENALLLLYLCREEYLGPYRGRDPDIENYIKAVERWKKDPDTYRFEKILLEHLVQILGIEN